jgi:hypothetical protein
VNALVILEGDRALSAGEDGFLELWDTLSCRALERWQISPGAVKALEDRPGKTQAAVIENDGQGFYRVSAWDYREKRRLFSRRFRDPAAWIRYSAGGNFLIAGGGGQNALLFLDPETGEILPSPPGMDGPLSFAATGRSERTMISYAPAGILSYRDLESGGEIRRLSVPQNIQSPLLFGGGRFLAGFDGQGLLILDAASGALLQRRGEPRRGILLQTGAEKAEFACLSPDGGEAGLYFFSAANTGALTLQARLPLPSPAPSAAASAFALLGGQSGEILYLPREGAARPLAVENQERVRDIAASQSVLGFLAGNGETGFIPLDYRALNGGDAIRLGPESAYTHISPGSGEGETEPFLLWQTAPDRDSPLVITGGGPETSLRVSPRLSLRDADLWGNRALLLDSTGTVTVMDIKTGDQVFSFSSLGAMDAVFLDGETFILGRSAVSGNSPFIVVNIATGETVPLPYPALIGARVYRGREGAVYAAAIDQGPGGSSTALIRLNTANPGLSSPLAEYAGEDTRFDIAWAGGIPASTLGADRAEAYPPQGARPFERSPGIPIRLIGGTWFISLDADGTVYWHEPATGKLEASLKLYRDRWVLETGGTVRQGPALRGD